MDPQTLYRLGSPSLGGPPMLELRYRVVSLVVGTDTRAVPLLCLGDLATVEAWIYLPFPGGWTWWRAVGYRLGQAIRRSGRVLASRRDRRCN